MRKYIICIYFKIQDLLTNQNYITILLTYQFIQRLLIGFLFTFYTHISD